MFARRGDLRLTWARRVRGVTGLRGFCLEALTHLGLAAGCETLWSEDMQHGMILDGGLKIINPFRAGG
jgi:hypothetical protein